jgi:hypothetical protein
MLKIFIVYFMTPCSLVDLLTYRISEREDGGSLYLVNLGTCQSWYTTAQTTIIRTSIFNFKCLTLYTHIYATASFIW